MSRNTDRPEGPRTPIAGRPIRRERRRNVPALTALEDRKLLTGGYGMPAAPMMMMPQAPAQVFQARMQASDPGAAQVPSNPTLSFEGDFVSGGDRGGWGSTTHTDASGQEWIYSGANAQFGPLGSLIFSGGAGANAALPRAGSPLVGSPVVPAASTDATTIDATVSDSSDATAASAAREDLDSAFEKYHADLQAIQDKSEVTPRLLAALRDARETIAAEAAGEPDEALVATLQEHQAAVLESGTFTDEQQATLKADYTAVLQGAGVSDGTIATFFAAQDAVKAASHVTADDLATLAADREAIQGLIEARGDAFQGQAPNSGVPAPGGFGAGMPRGGLGSELPGFAGDDAIPGGAGGPRGGGPGVSTRAIAPSGGVDAS